jgi:hypothetical protein
VTSTPSIRVPSEEEMEERACEREGGAGDGVGRRLGRGRVRASARGAEDTTGRGWGEGENVWAATGGSTSARGRE